MSSNGDHQAARQGRLDQLRRLRLNNRHLTQAGLVHLKQLPRLQVLDLRDSAVRASEAKVQEIETALPGVNIIR